MSPWWFNVFMDGVMREVGERLEINGASLLYARCEGE